MSWVRSTLALVAAALLAPPVWTAACPTPRQMDGFKTCANVEQAEKEGALVIYSPDPETNQSVLTAQFDTAFPKIKTTFLRLQTDALYAKLMAERQAESYLTDVLGLTDMTFVLDFQKRGGWLNYVSPEIAGYKPEHKSNPEGLFMWGGVIVAGIAYNPTTVKPEDAPKSWKDLLDPRWKDNINFKVSNSGLQHETWYMIKRVLGDDYWKEFAKQNPRTFDSYVQQFDHTVSGQDHFISIS